MIQRIVITVPHAIKDMDDELPHPYDKISYVLAKRIEEVVEEKSIEVKIVASTVGRGNQDQNRPDARNGQFRQRVLGYAGKETLVVDLHSFEDKDGNYKDSQVEIFQFGNEDDKFGQEIQKQLQLGGWKTYLVSDNFRTGHADLINQLHEDGYHGILIEVNEKIKIEEIGQAIATSLVNIVRGDGLMKLEEKCKPYSELTRKKKRLEKMLEEMKKNSRTTKKKKYLRKEMVMLRGSIDRLYKELKKEKAPEQPSKKDVLMKINKIESKIDRFAFKENLRPKDNTKISKLQNQLHRLYESLNVQKEATVLKRNKRQEEPGVWLWFENPKEDIIASLVGQEGNMRMRISTPRGSEQIGFPGADPKRVENRIEDYKRAIKRTLQQMGYSDVVCKEAVEDKRFRTKLKEWTDDELKDKDIGAGAVIPTKEQYQDKADALVDAKKMLKKGMSRGQIEDRMAAAFKDFDDVDWIMQQLEESATVDESKEIKDEISKSEFGKPYDKLTQLQKAEVDFVFDDMKIRKGRTEADLGMDWKTLSDRYKKKEGMLPVYKINGKLYFRDEKLGEYRNVENPSDSMPIDSVPNSKLQKPTEADRKKLYGEGYMSFDTPYEMLQVVHLLTKNKIDVIPKGDRLFIDKKDEKTVRDIFQKFNWPTPMFEEGYKFHNDKAGTLGLPIGDFEVIDEKPDTAHSGPWGSFSDLIVKDKKTGKKYSIPMGNAQLIFGVPIRETRKEYGLDGWKKRLDAVHQNLDDIEKISDVNKPVDEPSLPKMWVRGEAIDFADEIPKNAYLRVSKGFGMGELMPISKVKVRDDFSTDKSVERDAVGRILLYDKNGKLIGRAPTDRPMESKKECMTVADVLSESTRKKLEKLFKL